MGEPEDAVAQVAAAVAAIATMTTQQYVIGCDIADLRSALSDPDGPLRAFVGHGEAEGENRATRAADAAIEALKAHIAAAR